MHLYLYLYTTDDLNHLGFKFDFGVWRVVGWLIKGSQAHALSHVPEVFVCINNIIFIFLPYMPYVISPYVISDGWSRQLIDIYIYIYIYRRGGAKSWRCWLPRFRVNESNRVNRVKESSDLNRMNESSESNRMNEWCDVMSSRIRVRVHSGTQLERNVCFTSMALYHIRALRRPKCEWNLRGEAAPDEEEGWGGPPWRSRTCSRGRGGWRRI